MENHISQPMLTGKLFNLFRSPITVKVELDVRAECVPNICAALAMASNPCEGRYVP